MFFSLSQFSFGVPIGVSKEDWEWFLVIRDKSP